VLTDGVEIMTDGGQATITVTRIGSDSGAISVNYATNDDTTTAPDDYTIGTLNWADGDAANKTFRLLTTTIQKVMKLLQST
jgi:hypothetical protein